MEKNAGVSEGRVRAGDGEGEKGPPLGGRALAFWGEVRECGGEEVRGLVGGGEALPGNLTRVCALVAEIEALPGPWVPQDHEFCGPREGVMALARALRATGWKVMVVVPEREMLVLGGRDPWLWVWGESLWSGLASLAQEHGCELTGRGTLCPEDEEMEELQRVLEPLARARGWWREEDKVAEL